MEIKRRVGRVACVLAVVLFLSGLDSAWAQKIEVTDYFQTFDSTNGAYSTSDPQSSGILWTYSAIDGVGATGAWRVNSGDGDPSLELLMSPSISVPVDGTVILQFDHKYAFEPAWDGGVVDISVNGSAYVQVLNTAFTTNGYNGVIQTTDPWNIPEQLNGLDAFNGPNSGWLHSKANLGTFSNGDTIRVRFRGGWDWGAAEPNPNWVVDNVQLGRLMPPIFSLVPTNVTPTSASLNGMLISTGASATAIFVLWGNSDGGTNWGNWANTNIWAAPQGTGIYSYVASPLITDTNYYYRFASTNLAGTEWADASQFFITQAASLPSVDNGGGASSVTLTAALLSGTLTGGNPAPNIWIYWGTTNGGTNQGSWNLPPISIGQPGMTDFSSYRETLTPNQTYWYRSYATNETGEAWAPTSTNFTTVAVSISPANTSVWEGASGTTNAETLTVTLSAASVLPVTVSFATADGSATVAGGDYVPANTNITIPAGMVSTTITVMVIGDGVYEPDQTFTVNLTGAVNAGLGSNIQSTVTIRHQFYVRHSGSDLNSGAAWSDAFATLQKALDMVPLATPIPINVQASTGSQYYATCKRTLSSNGFYPSLTLIPEFQGGWQNVDTMPEQTGLSVIRSASTNEAGIDLTSPGHLRPINLTINRFSISDVTRGIAMYSGSGGINNDLILAVSNTTIRAQTDGIYLSYPRAYRSFGVNAGGPCRVLAENVDIVAGLAGAGHGVYSIGQWLGSQITASGPDPVSGAPRVSTITSLNGCGVYFETVYASETCQATFENTVIQGCSSSGIHLEVSGGYIVRATLENCTIADNGGDGLNLTGITAGSWGNATNCLFFNNNGHGLNLGTGGVAFASSEGYNLFFGDDLLVNGSGQALDGTTLTSDPWLWVKDAKPDPFYQLSSYASPAYHSGSDGSSRGAYQDSMSTSMAAPIIISFPVTLITETSADMVGNLITGGPPTMVTCYWGTNNGGTVQGQWMTNTFLGANTLGFLTNSVPSGLTASTLYYYRFYASNSLTWNWSTNTTVFATLGTAVGVNNDGGATNITPSSAELRGNMTVGTPPPWAWIYWGTTDGGTNKGNWNLPALPIGQPGIGLFSAGASNLMANNAYWYRCYVSNVNNEAWSPSSTTFTTAPPNLVISDVALVEGPMGTPTSALFTVTLSHTSAVDVSVGYTTTDGTATAADSDFVWISGLLTIPASNLTAQIPVTVNGDTQVELLETFYLDLTSGVSVVISDARGACTIANDDFTFYVRHSGNDTNNGSGWSDAFASLQQALTKANVFYPTFSSSINVEASTGSQSYATCSKVYGSGGGPSGHMTWNFQGGWKDVDTTPTQTGLSAIRDPATNNIGIYFEGGYHGFRKTLIVNRFAISAVTEGIVLTLNSDTIDGGDIILVVNNSIISAENNGIREWYFRPGYAGWSSQFYLTNVTIRAGLAGSGTGDGLYVGGSLDGSHIAATEPGASAFSSVGGHGIRLVGSVSSTVNINNSVIYDCERDGVNASNNYAALRVSMNRCTIADNGGDGLRMLGASPGSWGNPTDSIFANNGAHGLNLGTGGMAFASSENYNVFFNDDIFVNGAAQGVYGATSTADPRLFARKLKPDPWYKISSLRSPAFHSDSTGGNRGAYQSEALLITGTIVTLR